MFSSSCKTCHKNFWVSKSPEQNLLLPFLGNTDGWIGSSGVLPSLHLHTSRYVLLASVSRTEALTTTMDFTTVRRFRRYLIFFTPISSQTSRLSRTTTRLQNLFQVLPAVLVRRLMVVQLLLQIGDLGSGLGALTGKTLVNSIDGDIDEPSPVVSTCPCA